MQVYRQEEVAFVDLLNAVRCAGDAACNEAKRQMLAQCGAPLDESDGIRPTLLYSKNADVSGVPLTWQLLSASACTRCLNTP